MSGEECGAVDGMEWRGVKRRTEGSVVQCKVVCNNRRGEDRR